MDPMAYEEAIRLEKIRRHQADRYVDQFQKGMITVGELAYKLNLIVKEYQCL